MIDRAAENHPATAGAPPPGSDDNQLGVASVRFGDDFWSRPPTVREAHDRPYVIALDQRPRVIQQVVRLLLVPTQIGAQRVVERHLEDVHDHDRRPAVPGEPGRASSASSESWERVTGTTIVR